ncbi:DUF6223 family protein [Actinoplanes sp. TRM 88003]|uniref:DUF6223 family protein n=1 Tax=Paractinoplanes aksuensis TaxID=2939490 RepID=A0ABT1DU21_9ACTN|nr:DUF6223 family protein [Actinoplanes aksuensis]MCO8274351.1 DUF6223 family protein [Actinoplanes aksuensis]
MYDHEIVAAAAYTFTTSRIFATAGALIALAGVVLARSSSRRRAVAAVTASLIGLLTGGLVIALADGGPGSGSGVVGGYVALVLGLIGAGLALTRKRADR